MAIKIIENENGTVTEKTSKQIARERKLGKFKKAKTVLLPKRQASRLQESVSSASLRRRLVSLL